MSIDWSVKNTKEAELFFSTDLTDGLSKRFVYKNREIYGLNNLSSEFMKKQNFFGIEKKKNNIKSILSRSADVISIIFIIVVLILEIMEISTGNIILILFLLSGMVFTTIQGILTERRYLRLYDSARPKVTVIRGGKMKKIHIEWIVPGDVLILNKGDIIPADARLIRANNITVAENFGKREIKNKTDDVLPENHFQVKDNIIYASSILLEGNGTAVVVCTGSNCYISSKDGEAGNFSPETELSEIQREVINLSKKLTLAKIIVLFACIFISLTKGMDVLKFLIISLTLTIAAPVEWLPVLADSAIVYFLHKYIKKGILIKNVSTVDKLNKVNTLIAYKNEAFTQNKLMFDFIYADNRSYGISVYNSPDIAKFIIYMSLCSNVDVTEKHGVKRYYGQAADTLIYQSLELTGIDIDAVKKDYTILEKPYYDGANGLKISLVRYKGKNYIISFGDAENIINRSARYLAGNRFLDNDEFRKFDFKNKIRDFYKQYDLILGLAVREYRYPNADDLSSAAKDMDFLCFAVFSEPKHAGVSLANSQMRKCGMKTVMAVEAGNISAVEFAKKHGFFANDRYAVMNEETISRIEDGLLYSSINTVRMLVGISAYNKLRVIKALKFRKNTVAATVREINDLPVINHSAVSFAEYSSAGVVANKASVNIKNMSLDVILKTIKIAFTIDRNIRNMLVLLVSVYLTQYMGLIVFLIAGFTLRDFKDIVYLINAKHMMWLSTGLALSCAFAVSRNENYDKWTILRKKHDVKGKLSVCVLKSSIKNLSVIFFVSFLSVLGFIMLTGRFQPDTAASGSMSGFALASEFIAKSASEIQTWLFITFFSSVISLSLAMIQKKKLFSLIFLQNKSFIAAVIVNTVAVAVIMAIPFLREYFGFAILSPAGYTAAFLAGFLGIIFYN